METWNKDEQGKGIMVTIKINGKNIKAPEGGTILEAARASGI